MRVRPCPGKTGLKLVTSGGDRDHERHAPPALIKVNPGGIDGSPRCANRP